MATNEGSGFYFLDTFESCLWKGLLKYYYDLVPEFTPPALVWGGAIHKGVAAYKQGNEPKFCADVFAAEMEARQADYEKRETWELDLSRGIKLINLYCLKYPNELDEYEMIAIEEDLFVEIEGFAFHFKVDAVKKARRTGLIVLDETKTSSSLTPEKVFGKVRDQDQITGYLFAWNANHPEAPCEVAIPDVLYNNKGVFDCKRMESGVYRNRAELDEWARGTVQFLGELTQRMKSLISGEFDQHQLFKRAFSCDGDGFFRCDYKSICRSGYPRAKGDIPYGFKKRERKE